MTIYQPGDLLLVGFPFSSGTQIKNRPALVVIDTGDEDIVVARVTTHLAQTTFDVNLSEWQPAGLLAPSVVRLHKLATISKTLISRFLGKLQPNDRQAVAATLPTLLAGW